MEIFRSYDNIIVPTKTKGKYLKKILPLSFLKCLKHRSADKSRKVAVFFVVFYVKNYNIFTNFQKTNLSIIKIQTNLLRFWTQFFCDIF